MRQFRALYNFDAQDKVELTVKKGEVVINVEGDVHDGWVKVEVLSDPKRRGFVPLNYLREIVHSVAEQGSILPLPLPPSSSSGAAELVAEASMPRQPSAIPRESTQSFTSAAIDYGEALHNMYCGGAPEPSASSQRSRSEERAALQNNQPQEVVVHLQSPSDVQQRGESLTKSNSDPVADRSLLNDPNAVVQAFMKNELHFKQLMRQRQDALSQMRSTLEGAMNDVAMCREKNTVLAHKLRELDRSVDKERKSWKERVMEEKAYINRSMLHEKSESLTRRSPSSYNRS